MFPKKFFITAFTDNQRTKFVKVSQTLFEIKFQHQLSDLWSLKNSFLDYSFTRPRKFSFQEKKPFYVFTHRFDNIFTMPSFTCDGDSKIFWGGTSGFWATFIFPGSNIFLSHLICCSLMLNIVIFISNKSILKIWHVWEFETFEKFGHLNIKSVFVWRISRDNFACVHIVSPTLHTYL